MEVIQPVNIERSKYTCLAKDRYSKIELVSILHQSYTIRSMHLQRSKRNSRTLSFLMPKMDYAPNRDASVYRNSQEQHFILPRRKITIR